MGQAVIAIGGYGRLRGQLFSVALQAWSQTSFHASGGSANAEQSEERGCIEAAVLSRLGEPMEGRAGVALHTMSELLRHAHLKVGIG